MAYIGKTPITGNFVKLDAISVVNGQAGYTMNNGGSAFTDYENVNQFLVSLNGILQAPTTSFTVSGSTLTFASNLATGDVIDFVMVLGNTLDIGTPSDSTVTQAKTNFVSTSSAAGLQIKGDGTTDGTLQLNCSQNSHGIKLKSPAHSASASYTLTFPTTDGNADQFLQSNGSGVLTWADAGGGLEEADQWRLTSGISATSGSITANLERNDTSFAYVGTGMSESSGVFTFPSTGIYLVLYTVVAYGNSQGDIRYAGGSITATTNNSSYTNLSEMYNGCNNHGATYYMCSTQQAIFDVTNVSTHKIRLQIASSSTVTFVGNTNNNTTCVTFLKLGAT